MDGRAPLVGRAAPPIEGVAPDGEPAGAAGDGRVVFLTSSCLACRDLWPTLGRPGADVVAAVTPDPTLEDAAAVAALAPAGVPVVMSTAAWLAWRAGPAPWVAEVRGGVVVAEGPAD